MKMGNSTVTAEDVDNGSATTGATVSPNSSVNGGGVAMGGKAGVGGEAQEQERMVEDL